MVLGLPASAVVPLPQIIRNAVAKVSLKNKARSCHLSKEFPHLSEWKPKTLIWPSGPLLTVTPSHHVPALSGSLCQATLTCLIALKQTKHWRASGPLHLQFLLLDKLFIQICAWRPPSLPLGPFSNDIYQWDHLWHQLIWIHVYMCICVCLHIYVFIYDLSYVWFVGCLSPPARM